MKLKKLLCSILLILCVFMLTGCASVEYNRIISSDGTILDAVSVKLDTTKITNAGFEISQVKSDVKAKMNNYLNAIIYSFQNREDLLSPIEKIAVLNNITYGVYETKEYLIASFKFKNYNTFKYFYGLHLIEDEEEEDNTTTIEEFLINKNVTTGKTIFSGADAEYITNDFLSYFNHAFTIDDTNLSYVFGTNSNKLYSDANYKYTEDGINYHQWIISDINQEINTYTIQVKPINWYVLALILTVLLILILFIISYILKLSGNNKKNLIIENATEIYLDDKNNKQ